MKVHELIGYLEDMPEDAEVRLAIQPSWPFEHRIGNVVEVNLNSEEHEACDGEGCAECQSTGRTNADGEDVVVYIGEGGQIGYLPGAVKDEVFSGV